MMNIDLASPFTGILSVSVLAFSAMTSLVSYVAGPTISGSAEYSQPVRAGETVLVKWTFHKTGPCPGENSRVWTGERGFHVTEATKRNSLPITDKPFTPVIPTKIPDRAPPGKLTLAIKGECGTLPFTLGPVTFNVTAD